VAIHRDNEDRDICMSLGFCNGELEEHSMYNTAKLQCGVCVAALEQIWGRFSIDVSPRDVRQVLNEVCPKYPSSEDFCKSLQLKGSVSRIIEGILTNQTPHYTCAKLNLCNSPETNSYSESVPIVKGSQQGSSKLRCSICNGLYLLSKTYYDSTGDITQMQQQLASLCHTAPPSLKNPCNELLQYRSVFELAITSNADSLEACQAVEFCTDSDSDNAGFSFSSLFDRKSLSSGNVPPLECQACQWGVSAVEAYLSQDNNVQDLGNVLQALCTVLPPPYTGICKNFIALYLDEAMLVILDTLTPPIVCSQLGVCPKA